MAVRITGAGVALTVGIIIVTGLIIGGLFWIRGAGEQARRDEATKIAQQQLEEESRNDVALNDGDEEKASENESHSSAESGTSNNGNEQSTSTHTGGATSDSNTSTAGGAASELPRTGAGDIMPVVALALLVFSMASYIVSKRQLSQY